MAADWTSSLPWIIFVILPLLNITISNANNNIVVINGGYRNITVAIGERVKQSENADLLQKIRDDFTEASRSLFEATQ